MHWALGRTRTIGSNAQQKLLKFENLFVCAQGEPVPVPAAGIIQAAAPHRVDRWRRGHRQAFVARGRSLGVRSFHIAFKLSSCSVRSGAHTYVTRETWVRPSS